ncbi:hypothetical protein V7263_08360 [Bacillus subtilis]|uniref:hypothetical protein n=1 Tax=Bacillus subtilis TaxID=1423 RepID=UPI002040F121|nr:hypothetical protein [Bacillus subtilis]MCM3156122.1 hypothetical protein [Bacillus subtilis]
MATKQLIPMNESGKRPVVKPRRFKKVMRQDQVTDLLCLRQDQEVNKLLSDMFEF